MNQGIALVELASRTVELFEKQEPLKKRLLLDFVFSNCTWTNGELTPQFRQPFDVIADAATACAKEKAAGASSDGLRLLMGPWIDTFRTLFTAPPSDVLGVLQDATAFAASA